VADRVGRCAHAAAGDAEDCHRPLGEAADALTLIRADPEPEDLDFDEGGYCGYAALAYRDLGGSLRPSVAPRNPSACAWRATTAPAPHRTLHFLARRLRSIRRLPGGRASSATSGDRRGAPSPR